MLHDHLLIQVQPHCSALNQAPLFRRAVPGPTSAQFYDCRKTLLKKTPPGTHTKTIPTNGKTQVNQKEIPWSAKTFVPKAKKVNRTQAAEKIAMKTSHKKALNQLDA